MLMRRQFVEGENPMRLKLVALGLLIGVATLIPDRALANWPDKSFEKTKKSEEKQERKETKDQDKDYREWLKAQGKEDNEWAKASEKERKEYYKWLKKHNKHSYQPQ